MKKNIPKRKATLTPPLTQPKKRLKTSQIPSEPESLSDSSSNSSKIASKPKKIPFIPPQTIQQLISLISTNTKSHYRSKFDQSGALLTNVANFGVSSHRILIMERKGEYHGVSVQVLKDLDPLFTHQRVIEALSLIEEGKLPSAIKKLYIEEEIKHWGLNALYYALGFWLEINDLPNINDLKADFTIFSNAKGQEKALLDTFKAKIKRNRHDPLDSPLKVKKAYNFFINPYYIGDFYRLI